MFISVLQYPRQKHMRDHSMVANHSMLQYPPQEYMTDGLQTVKDHVFPNSRKKIA